MGLKGMRTRAIFTAAPAASATAELFVYFFGCAHERWFHRDRA